MDWLRTYGRWSVMRDSTESRGEEPWPKELDMTADPRNGEYCIYNTKNESAHIISDTLREVRP